MSGNSAAISDAELIAEPRWFPAGFEPRGGNIAFFATDRATLAGQAFLDGRWKRAPAGQRSAHAATLIREMPQQMPRPNFIWHTGFCCSTLLAKALDRSGRNLSLCEPQIMVEIADAKRGGAFTRDAAGIPQLVFHLLARRFAPDAHVTVKPAPAANFLLHDAALCTSGPMLFLYSDCRSFLISIAKLGEEGRKYARRMFLAILGDGNAQSKWPAQKHLLLSDLEMAAQVWHMQIAEFLRNWPLLGATRAFSLDCDAFLAEPAAVLNRLDEVFSLGLGSEHIGQVVAGQLFSSNAKTGERAFDARRRREEHSRIELQLGGDLDRVVEQSYAQCGATPRGAPLPNPLVTFDKRYYP